MKSFTQDSIALPDGRQLAYQFYGLPEGKPVYIFHGFPGSRIQLAFLHEKAARAQLRQRFFLITTYTRVKTYSA